MDCANVRQNLQDAIDGRLPPPSATEVRGHLAACPACAAEEAALLRVGEMLRLWASSRALESDRTLEAMWLRVDAGIRERRREAAIGRLRKWFWLPAAAALAVLALMFYPSPVSRAPFHPTSFEVSVEDLESDEATVALVDKGDDLPRVIWIIQDGKT